jgi:hypothetical protein
MCQSLTYYTKSFLYRTGYAVQTPTSRDYTICNLFRNDSANMRAANLEQANPIRASQPLNDSIVGLGCREYTVCLSIASVSIARIRNNWAPLLWDSCHEIIVSCLCIYRSPLLH